MKCITRLIFPILFFFTFAASAATVTYDFTNSADYDLSGDASIDSDTLNLAVDHTEEVYLWTDDAEADFDLGTYATTLYTTGLTADYDAITSSGGIALPSDNGNSWADMSGNELLLRMDDDSETTYSDSSGNDNDFSCATASNCPNLNAAGFVDGAADFMSESDSERYLSGAAPFDPAETLFSVEMWINPEDSPNFDSGSMLLAQDMTAVSDPCDTFGWILLLKDLDDDGTANLCTFLGGSQYCSDDVIPLAEWSHVALVRDFYSVQLYVNGVVYESDNSVAYYLTDDDTVTGDICMQSNTNDFYIGTNAEVGAPYRGLIDELAIYSRRLSDNEVLSHFLSAHFDSQIFDTGASETNITGLSWQTTYPVQKPLPDFGGVETVYDSDNADMTDNEILMHFDSIDGLGTDETGISTNDYTAGCVFFCPTQITNGKFNNAFAFDGNASLYVQDGTTNLTFDSSTTDFSAALWLRIEEWPIEAAEGGIGDEFDQVILSQDTGNGTSGRSWLYIDNQTNELCSFLGNDNNCTSGIPLSKGFWQHVVLTKTGTTLRIYVNGVHESTFSETVESADGAFYVGSNKINEQFFIGEIDEVAIFTRELTLTEVQDHYQRGQKQVAFQLRTCDDDACDGEEFVGPDGTSNSFYSEMDNDAVDFPDLTTSGLDSNRYVQYRAVFGFVNGAPALVNSVSLEQEVSSYDSSGEAFAELTVGAVEFATLSGFSAVEGSDNEGTIQYQLSPDGTTFYYFDGSSWVEATEAAESNTESTVDANISTFASDVSAGSIFFRAFLLSDGTQAVELEDVTFTYSAATAGDDDDDDDDDGSTCGDSTVDADEECDDGNTVADDGCSATCTDEEVASSGGGGGCALNALASNSVTTSSVVGVLWSILFALRLRGKTSSQLT